MQPDYDLYEDELEQGGFRWMSVAVLLLSVVGFFSLAWYAYEMGSQTPADEEEIIIKADRSPIKRAPEDPGGREFAHQDKTIYEVVQERKPQPSQEQTHVLPAPETPSRPERLIPEPVPEPKAEPALDSEIPAEAADEKIAEIIRGAVKNKQTNENIQWQELQPEQTPAEKPVTEDPFRKTEQPKKSLGNILVQVGAFRSQDKAEEKWRKIQSSHEDILGNMPHTIVKADLGEKGIYYRLRIGGFDSAAQAKSTCKTLERRRQGCFLVR